VEVDRAELAEVGGDGRFRYLHALPCEVGGSAPLAGDEKDDPVVLAPGIAVECDRMDPVAVARFQPKAAGAYAAAAATGALIAMNAPMSKPSTTIRRFPAKRGPYATPKRRRAGAANLIR
jgi:hypothetical protein